MAYYPVIGGTETYVLELTRRMASRGHSVTVHTSFLNPNYNGQLLKSDRYQGVEVIRHKLFPPYLFFPKLKGDGVIHMMTYGPLYYTLESFLHRNNSLVCTPIGEEVIAHHKLRNRILGSSIFDSANMNIALSPSEMSFLIDKYKVKEDKVTVIPHGVGDDSFLPPDKSSITDVSIASLLEETYFVTLARVVPFKRIDLGIEILASLPAHCKYVIIGPLQDKKHYQELLRLADKLHVRSRVHFLGMVDENTKRTLLSRSAFLLRPGTESFGIVPFEAMAQGVPIVTSDHVVNCEIVTDGYNGLIFEKENASSGAQKALCLIDDTKMRNELGRNGRELTISRYHWNAIADRTENVYKQVLDI